MLFSRDDFRVDSLTEFFSFCLVAPFVALMTPFMLVSYTLGLVQDIVGWLDT